MRSSASRRRAAVLAVAAVTLIGALSAAPASADPADAPVDCESASTPELAAAAAVDCGAEVEVLPERTPWTTTYAAPDGSFRTETSNTAVRTDINGAWEDIDTALDDGDDGLSTAATVYGLTFSDATPGQPLATISDGSRTLSMHAPIPLTTPIVEGNTITYPDVLPDVDLLLQVHSDGTGFSEVFRVNTAQAAENPALADLEFSLQVEGDLTLVPQGEGFAAQDSTGQNVFVSPAPIMWDSASTELPGTQASRLGVDSTTQAAQPAPEDAPPTLQPNDGDVVAAVDTTLTGDSVTITPDQDLLTDPETVYPVYIDPTVSGDRAGRTIVRSGYPTDDSFYNFSGDQGLGYCAISGGCDRNGVYRMFFKFDGLSAISALTSADVIEASFRIYGQHSWSCTATGVQLWRTAQISSSTTWNTQPDWVERLQTQNLSHKESCGTTRWVEWDVTAAAEHMAAANNAHVTFGLRTSNESSMSASWQRYRGDVTFSVTYSRPPSAPTALSTSPATTCGSNPAYLRTSTPDLRWKVADPDGGNVRGSLRIVNVNSGATVYNPTVPAQASGSQFTVTVPANRLGDGGTYEWSVGGIDVTTGRAGPTSSCRFTIDLTAPGTPTVEVSSTTRPATYPENTVSGGVGMTGRFRIEGASDVDYFRYSFNSDALNKQVDAVSGVAGIDFTPTAAGSQRLLVQAVDRAGWVSSTRTYRFSVDFPGETVIWRLDDGSGTTAQDAVGDNDLTVSSSTQWVNGMLADLANNSTDTALRFDSTSDSATSAATAVNTSESYTVMAFVNLAALTTAPQTAVSISGQATAALHLGQIGSANCGSTSYCWFLQVRSADSAVGGHTRLHSTIPATANGWIHLTGIVDNANDTVSLYVCDPASNAEPALAGTAPMVAPVTWAAGGNVEIGRSVANGAPGYDNYTNGTIDDVRIYDNIVDITEIRDVCEGDG